jgi:hypothetical protein
MHSLTPATVLHSGTAYIDCSTRGDVNGKADLAWRQSALINNIGRILLFHIVGFVEWRTGQRHETCR